MSSWVNAGTGRAADSRLCGIKPKSCSELPLQLLEGQALERDSWCCLERALHAASLPSNITHPTAGIWNQTDLLGLAKGIAKETAGLGLFVALNGLLSLPTTYFAYVYGLGLISPCMADPQLPSELAAVRNSVQLAWQTTSSFSYLKLMNAFMLKQIQLQSL